MQTHQIEPLLPLGKCSLLLTSRNRNWEISSLEIGPFSEVDAVDFLLQYTKAKDSAAEAQIAIQLDYLPTSLEKAAQLVLQKNVALNKYFETWEDFLEENARYLKERSNLPSRNKYFVGREMTLVALEETFEDSNIVVVSPSRIIAAEVGMGGIGKTQIAIQYGYRNGGKYPFLTWWFNAESASTLDDAYRNLANRLDIFLTQEEQKEKHGLIKRVNQELERKSGWLLIYDNAEDEKSIQPFLPKTGGHILITSRSSTWSIAKAFEVELFKRQESIALIQKLAPHLSKDEANQIALLVQDLPIAVAQAAAYIGQVKITAQEYIHRFNAMRKELFPAQHPAAPFSKTVDVTWKLSMNKIAELEKLRSEKLNTPFPIAQPLMEFCSFLASANIPKEILLLKWMEKNYRDREKACLNDLDETLNLLSKFSMIKNEREEISIHSLVQLVTRDMLEENELKEKCSQSIKFFDTFFQYDDVYIKEIQNNVRLIIHAEKVARHGFDYKVEIEITSLLAANVALYLHYQGANGKAELILEECLNNARSFCQEGAIGEIRVILGTVLHELGKYSEAKKEFLEALNIYKKMGPEADTHIANTKLGLGNLLKTLGQNDEAKEESIQALQIYEKNCFANFPFIAEKISNLGNTLQLIGKYAAAKELHSKAREIKEKTNLISYPSIAASKNDLGNILPLLSQYSEAIEQYSKAIELFEAKAKNNSDPLIQRSLNEVKDQFLKTVETYEKKCYAISNLINNLGMISEALGQNIKAKKLYSTVIEIKEKTLPNHPSLADTYNNLGNVLQVLGYYKAAEKHYKKSLEIKEKAFPATHPLLAVTKNNLGNLLQLLGRYAEAKEQYSKAIEIFEKAYSPTYPSIVVIKNNLGGVLLHLHQNAEAKELYRKVLETCKQIYPSDHPYIAAARNNLGLVMLNLRQYVNAEKQFIKALAIYEKAYPDGNHPSISQVRDNLTLCATLLGENPKG